MKKSIKYIAVLLSAFGVVSAQPVAASTVAEPAAKMQEGDATYARELKALLKKHQQEWDEMIQQQTDAVKDADVDTRAELTGKHREERKEMEARHRKEVAALKEKYVG